MRHLYLSGVTAVILLSALVSACSPKSPPAEQGTAKAAPSGDTAFATLEHEYVVYFMQRFPVVATYLGGSEFDPALAGIDAKLRDYSAAALTGEDTALAQFKQRFAALDDAGLSPRRRIDKSVALAQIEFLLREHSGRHYQQRAVDTALGHA